MSKEVQLKNYKAKCIKESGKKKCIITKIQTKKKPNTIKPKSSTTQQLTNTALMGIISNLSSSKQSNLQSINSALEKDKQRYLKTFEKVEQKIKEVPKSTSVSQSSQTIELPKSVGTQTKFIIPTKDANEFKNEINKINLDIKEKEKKIKEILNGDVLDLYADIEPYKEPKKDVLDLYADIEPYVEDIKPEDMEEFMESPEYKQAEEEALQEILNMKIPKSSINDISIGSVLYSEKGKLAPIKDESRGIISSVQPNINSDVSNIQEFMKSPKYTNIVKPKIVKPIVLRPIVTDFGERLSTETLKIEDEFDELNRRNKEIIDKLKKPKEINFDDQIISINDELFKINKKKKELLDKLNVLLPFEPTPEPETLIEPEDEKEEIRGSNVDENERQQMEEEQQEKDILNSILQKEINNLESQLRRSYDNLQQHELNLIKAKNLPEKTDKQIKNKEIKIQKLNDNISFNVNESNNLMRQIDEKLQQQGNGSNTKDRGTYDYEIEDMLKNMKNFKGVVPADKLDTLEVSPKMSFIFNTDTSDKGGSHWVAVNIDSVDDKSVEVFNPLADDTQDIIKAGLKKIVDKINPKTLLKFKENKIKSQNSNSSTCAFHAIRFLKDRSNGVSFKDATYYKESPQPDQTVKGEKEAEQVKKQNGFGYI